MESVDQFPLKIMDRNACGIRRELNFDAGEIVAVTIHVILDKDVVRLVVVPKPVLVNSLELTLFVGRQNVVKFIVYLFVLDFCIQT